jgi:hypothetical protein
VKAILTDFCREVCHSTKSDRAHRLANPLRANPPKQIGHSSVSFSSSDVRIFQLFDTKWQQGYRAANCELQQGMDDKRVEAAICSEFAVHMKWN